MTQRLLLTTEQVAETLGQRERTILWWVKLGRLKGQKVGRGWRFALDDVEALRRELFPPSAAEEG